jgi:hypothetical protein
MSKKDSGQERKKLSYVAKEERGGTPYQLVYETAQGTDVEVQIIPAGSYLYTIETSWYRAQVRTYDLLDTIVRFCKSIYGEGTLTVVLV